MHIPSSIPSSAHIFIYVSICACWLDGAVHTWLDGAVHTWLDGAAQLDPALVRIPALVIYGEVRLPPPAAALKAAAAKAAAASAPLCGVV
mmetsp:Transcript_1260/g.3353  ORF Transcript_1260/g.3353 Transcript_1260/m.3353 type:complete len:90 (+) Transcript_1260:1197-1466(+)